MLPADSKARKALPLARGVLDYFPDAIAAVADLSQKGNDKHNPGEPLHWSRDKSSDHADCIMRHLVERGTVDPEDGILHDVKVAWRALAMAQLALEKQRPIAKAPTPELLKRDDPAPDFVVCEVCSRREGRLVPCLFGGPRRYI